MKKRLFGSFLASMLMLAFAGCATSGRARADSTPWQYDVTSVSASFFVENHAPETELMLNCMAQQGWQLVFISAGDENTRLVFVFRKRI